MCVRFLETPRHALTGTLSVWLPAQQIFMSKQAAVMGLGLPQHTVIVRSPFPMWGSISYLIHQTSLGTCIDLMELKVHEHGKTFHPDRLIRKQHFQSVNFHIWWHGTIHEKNSASVDCGLPLFKLESEGKVWKRESTGKRTSMKYTKGCFPFRGRAKQRGLMLKSPNIFVLKPTRGDHGLSQGRKSGTAPSSVALSGEPIVAVSGL